MKIFYSVKANPNIHIIEKLKEYVDGMEVCSAGEIFLALKAGVLPENLIFVGPGKTIKELNFAISNNVGFVVIESLREAEQIEQIAEKQGKIVNTLIRVNPSNCALNAAIKMGGSAKQFGIDEEILEDVIKGISNLEKIQLKGIHCYSGTQSLDHRSIVENFKVTLKIAKKLEETNVLQCEYIDLGGGFGIDYKNKGIKIDIDELKLQLYNIVEEYNFGEKCQIFLESGRFLVAESGIYVTKVLYIKESRGKKFLIVDGGTNNGPSSYTNGRFLRSNPQITYSNDTGEMIYADIVGPLCTTTDYLAQNILIPKCLKEGDYIIIHNAGAYGYTAASKDFLSHEYPAEVLLRENGEHEIIRRRSNFDDFLKLY